MHPIARLALVGLLSVIASLALLLPLEGVAPVYCLVPLEKEIPRGAKKGLDASVMIEGPGPMYGTGVVFKRGDIGFVWTAAHVVSTAFVMEKVLRFNREGIGSETKRAYFRRVKLVREVYEDGEKVGEESRLASVLRYSDRHDLALLVIHGKKWPKNTVEFAPCKPCFPGESLWHVGSLSGPPGCLTLAPACFSTAGRLRKNGQMEEYDKPLVWDQFTGVVLPGCSGGGIFRRNGDCVGIVTEFVTAGSYGTGMYVPVRRMRKFARMNECEWAIDTDTPMPAGWRHGFSCDDMEVRP